MENQIDEIIDRFQEMSRWSLLRQLVLEICLSEKQAILFHPDKMWVPNDRGGLYLLPVRDRLLLDKYFECFYLMQLLVTKIASEIKTENQLAGDPEGLVVCRFMEEDVSRVNLPTALCCWLTTDDFRWWQIDKTFGSQFPDLSYELVKSYPRSVIAAAAFVCGFQTLKPYSRDKRYILLLEECREFVASAYQTFSSKEIEECKEMAAKTVETTLNQVNFRYFK